MCDKTFLLKFTLDKYYEQYNKEHGIHESVNLYDSLEEDYSKFKYKVNYLRSSGDNHVEATGCLHPIFTYFVHNYDENDKTGEISIWPYIKHITTKAWFKLLTTNTMPYDVKFTILYAKTFMTWMDNNKSEQYSLFDNIQVKVLNHYFMMVIVLFH